MSRVLFIQLSRLGDCLQSTPLLATWRARHPGDRITVLTHVAYATVFQGNPDVDAVEIYDPPVATVRDGARNPVERLEAVAEWVATLGAPRYDTVVNLTHDPLACYLTAALQPRAVRGLLLDPYEQTRAADPWSLYLLDVMKCREGNLLNLVDVYAHFAGGGSQCDALRFHVDERARREVTDWVDGSFVAFQPGANKAERRWPAESFIQLGRRIAADQGLRIAVLGSGDEVTLARRIAEAVPGAINFAGRTTIPQLAALLEAARCLVTNDTGTMHLAAAVGTPALALFEASAYVRETGPYGVGHWAVQSRQVLEYAERTEQEVQAVARIPVEEVAAALEALLDGGSPPALGASGSVDHYRSGIVDGRLDFYPALPVSLDAPALARYLARSVWLATLDGVPLDAAIESRRVMEHLESWYRLEDPAALAGSLEESRREVARLRAAVAPLAQSVRRILARLERNPKHVVPAGELSELTRLEQEVLALAAEPTLRPFAGYFELGLGMVEGDTTQRYLRSYVRPVELLVHQAALFEALIVEAVAALGSTTAPAARIASTARR